MGPGRIEEAVSVVFAECLHEDGGFNWPVLLPAIGGAIVAGTIGLLLASDPTDAYLAFVFLAVAFLAALEIEGYWRGRQ